MGCADWCLHGLTLGWDSHWPFSQDGVAQCRPQGNTLSIRCKFRRFPPRSALAPQLSCMQQLTRLDVDASTYTGTGGEPGSLLVTRRELQALVGTLPLLRQLRLAGLNSVDQENVVLQACSKFPQLQLELA